MKTISLTLAMASLLTLAACGDGQEHSDLSAVSISSNSLRMDANGSRNTCGGSTTVAFGGTDSQGRALFNVITRNVSRIPQIGRDSSCDIAPKLIFPGLKIRVKGITYAGSWSVQNAAFGSIDVSSGPRTAYTYSASQPVSGNNPNFLKSDFSMRADKFTNCGDSSLGEILMTRPSVTVKGGIAGKVPAIFPNLREINISIEAIKC